MQTKKLLLTFSLLLCMITVKAQFTGDWKGVLNVEGVNMELIFHITEIENGYSVTLDIPVRGVSGIQIEKTEVVDNQLTISSPPYNISFKGTLIKNNEIEGIFKQGDLNLQIKLSKRIKQSEK